MKEEILEGLKNALARGETLKYSMQSFYNAGYEKRDIEEAARELQRLMHERSRGAIEVYKNNKIVKPIKQHVPEKSLQRISSYEQPKKNPRKIISAIIIVLILILILVLGMGFWFRENLISFLNGLFG